MPFDPDELANGMMKWLEHGRNPKPAPAEPKPSPPPAEMPGSGPSIEELQEQIKALQEQLKALEGDGGAQFIPQGPGRDAPELTPEERRKKDWEMFDKWRQESDGVPDYALPRRPGPVPMPIYPRNDSGYIPHPDDNDIIADIPSWGPYKNQEKPRWEKLPYIPPEAGGTPPKFENLPYKRPENPNDNPGIQLLKGLKK